MLPEQYKPLPDTTRARHTSERAACLGAFLSDSLALWRVAGAVERGEFPVVVIIRADNGAIVWVERPADEHPLFRWLVRWRPAGDAPGGARAMSSLLRLARRCAESDSRCARRGSRQRGAHRVPRSFTACSTSITRRCGSSAGPLRVARKSDQLLGRMPASGRSLRRVCDPDADQHEDAAADCEHSQRLSQQQPRERCSDDRLQQQTDR